MKIFRYSPLFLPAICVLCGPGTALVRAQELWPELSSPAPAVGGGENDAAVVVGVEGYAFVSPVPGAESNAKLWHQYLTETRRLAPQNVKLLTGVDATREEILEAAHQAAGQSSGVQLPGAGRLAGLGRAGQGRSGDGGRVVAVRQERLGRDFEGTQPDAGYHG